MFQPTEPSWRLISSIAREVDPGFHLVAVDRTRQQHAADARGVQLRQQRFGNALGAFDLIGGGLDRGTEFSRACNRVCGWLV